MVDDSQLDPWSVAHREADARGLGHIGTDLVLLGLARTQGVAGEVLRDLGATPEAISRTIDETRTSGDRSARPTFDEHGRPWNVRATPAAEQARGRASGIAIALGQREAWVHLLLALAYDRSGSHASKLRRLGVSRTTIVDTLRERGVEVPSKPPPRDPDPTTQAVVLPDAHARLVVAELGRRSIADRAAYFDEEGHGRWGYGGVPERPDDARISAQASVDLRSIVHDVLEEAALPQPADDDWHSFVSF